MAEMILRLFTGFRIQESEARSQTVVVMFSAFGPQRFAPGIHARDTRRNCGDSSAPNNGGLRMTRHQYFPRNGGATGENFRCSLLTPVF